MNLDSRSLAKYDVKSSSFSSIETDVSIPVKQFNPPNLEKSIFEVESFHLNYSKSIDSLVYSTVISGQSNTWALFSSIDLFISFYEKISRDIFLGKIDYTINLEVAAQACVFLTTQRKDKKFEVQ